jgi:dTDP-4-amino-4,6-dideoxygalactose transaminase
MSPDITDQDIAAVTEVLKSGMLVQGKKVAELEETLAAYLGAEHAIALSNGTSTLHLALIALGVGPGDEVIVPAFSYIATANVVELVGAAPIFVDIDIRTFNIDVAQIEKHITAKTKAIMPVNEFGLAADLSMITAIAQKYRIPVIEDSACALGAKEGTKFTGTYGTLGSFSFHPRKAITSGEGGVLVTNDKALADKIRILRNHGIEMQNGMMEFVVAGFNYRMTDFQAAMLCSQLKRLDTIIEKRQKLAAVYGRELKNPKFSKPYIPEGKLHTWQTYHVVVDSSLDRNELIAQLKAQGIGTNYGAQCMPYQQFFKNKYKLDCEKLFPNAMLAYTNGLALPLYEKLNEEDIIYISNIINNL